MSLIHWLNVILLLFGNKKNEGEEYYEKIQKNIVSKLAG